MKNIYKDGLLTTKVTSVCRQVINYLEQEESYKAEQPYTGKFSGRRVHRGLYKSSDGTVINADINGAANILRKSKQNFNFEELCRGLLASPQRIRLL